MSDSEAPTVNGIAVLHDGDDLLAVDKPAGLMVHPSRISQDTDFLLPRLSEALGCRLHPVHRLDRATSGVVLLARSREAAAFAGKAFQERRVSKTYLAVVRGWTQPRTRIDYPLSARGRGGEQTAVTDIRRLVGVELPFAVGRYPSSRYSLVMARPLTGRTHQIRRHLKHVFHPIVGDTSYGEGRHNRFFRMHYGIHRMLLHAHSLCLPAPSGGRLRLVAPLPETFQRLIAEWSGVPEPATAATDPRPGHTPTG